MIRLRLEASPAPRLFKAVLASCLIAAQPGCSDPAGDDTPGPAAAFSVVSGNGQSGVVATALAQPLVVKVTDANGRPVPGQLVNFVVAAGGGHLFSGGAQTDAEGLAADLWTLGPLTADSQKVEVRAVDPATGQPRVYAAFRATALPGVPATLGRITSPVSGAFSGQPLPTPLEVKLTDGAGNGVPGQTVTWAARSASTVTASTTTDAQGLSRTAVTVGPTGGDTIVAAWNGHTVEFLVPVQLTGISIVAGNGQTAPAGTFFPDSLTVLVTDSLGNPVPAGVAVHWRGVLRPDLVTAQVTRTRADGTARIAFRSESAAGDYVAAAHSDGSNLSQPEFELLFTEHATGPITIPTGAFLTFPTGVASRQGKLYARVSGVNPLTEVTGAIAGRSAILTYASPFYTGTIDMRGLPSGVYYYVITARDAAGNTAQRTAGSEYLLFQ
jgi:hypothetical protein